MDKAQIGFGSENLRADFSSRGKRVKLHCVVALLYAGLTFALLLIGACSYPITMQSSQGETYVGRYRFGRDDSGLMQISGPDNEVLVGRFSRVGRTTFVERYEKAFGRGTIELDGPDLSLYAGSLSGFLGPTSGFHETAYADPAAAAEGRPTKSITGPLFYWVASLQGDRRTVLGCYFVGSSYTGGGFGRCRSQAGEVYSIDF